MLHIVSTFVLCLIAAGLSFRHVPRVHARFMLSAFVIDLALVLYIEFSRSALNTVTSSDKTFIWFHAVVSTGVLVLYVVQIVLGRKLLRGEVANRKMHIIIGVSFCILRLVNYVTSFYIDSSALP